ncbi:MAG: SCO family protein [Oleiphilaceae bacterium]|nr:SCO family protein [Oleiphilaceae bacterium]
MPDLEFELVNTDSKPVTAEDFAGQVRLMFFGFTSCPDICPATLSYLQKAIKQMPEELQEDVTVLFVSVDPDRDTPEKMQQYTGFFGDNIAGLVAEEKPLRELAKRYRTTFGYGKPDSSGHYDVSHSNAIYVFDTEGKVRLLLRSELTSEQVTEDLTALAASG